VNIHLPPRLTVAVVIITFLRPQVLRSTLATWLASHRVPDQFLIVDASPDADHRRPDILRDFTELFVGRGSDYLVARTPSTTTQRNQAIAAVWTDVVMFVDDESRPEPNYVERVLEIFELDEHQHIGGVGGSERDEETFVPRLKARIEDAVRLVARSFPMSRDQAFPRGIRIPDEVKHLRVRLVRQLYGNNMSFRASLLATELFDERMLRYGYCEDLDLSIRLSRAHALVRRTDAFVAHDEARLGRIGGNARFLIGWINPAYITEKHFPLPSNRRPLDRLLALSRTRALALQLLRRDVLGRRTVVERFEVAAAMVAFVREGTPAALGDRFSALQHRIFHEVTDEELVRPEPYRRWEAEIRRRIDSPDSSAI
jgi:GT2 family glycosyltransferase